MADTPLCTGLWLTEYTPEMLTTKVPIPQQAQAAAKGTQGAAGLSLAHIKSRVPTTQQLCRCSLGHNGVVTVKGAHAV